MPAQARGLPRNCAMHAHVSPCGTWIAGHGHQILDLDAQIATDFKIQPASDLKSQQFGSLLFQLRCLPSLPQNQRRFWLRFRWRSVISNSLRLQIVAMWASKRLMKTSTSLEHSIWCTSTPLIKGAGPKKHCQTSGFRHWGGGEPPPSRGYGLSGLAFVQGSDTMPDRLRRLSVKGIADTVLTMKAKILTSQARIRTLKSFKRP